MGHVGGGVQWGCLKAEIEEGISLLEETIWSDIHLESIFTEKDHKVWGKWEKTKHLSSN